MDTKNFERRSIPNTRPNYHSPYHKPQMGIEEKMRFAENQQKNRPSKEGDAEKRSPSQKTVKTFRDLAIWQKGLSLAATIYKKTGLFPKDELYGLVTQMRRAAVSVPSNIAEGYRRRHAKEFQQFLNIALGSLGELETQIIISGKLNYFSAENETLLLEDIDHLTRMVISLGKKVDR